MRKFLGQNAKNLLPIFALTLIPTILIWLPFFARINSFWTIPLKEDGMASVVSNYDGPLYIVAAKSFYNAGFIKDNYQFNLPTEYYSAHFPAFPFVIKLFAGFFGFPYSILFSTVLFSFLSLYYFHKLAQKYVKKEQALWLTAVFAVFPARWLVVRSVGSAEPLFIAVTLASLYYFNQKKYFVSGLFGMVSAMTKSPGILLFFGYFLTIITPHLKTLATAGFVKFLKSLELNKKWPVILVPAGTLAVFSLYGFIYNDFFVYFKSGDNIHLFFPPFQIFNSSAPWVGTYWLEEIIFVYLLGAIGVYKLKTQKLDYLYHFALVFFVSLLFVAHRDLVRYGLPIAPLMLIAFKDVLLSKEFKFAFWLILIPIFLYSLSFISQNTMPISNWQPFL